MCRPLGGESIPFIGIPGEAAMRSIRLIVSAFVLLSVSSGWAVEPPVQGLGASGTIHGTVQDQNGAVVAGAKVELQNPLTGFQRETTTAADGTYQFVNLPKTKYHMTVSASGFASASLDAEVASGVPVEVPVTLAIGKSSLTVDVTDAGDLIETDPSAHSNVDEKVLARVPLERSSGLSQVITQSAPGVVADSNGFFHPLGDHAQTSFSIDNQSVSDQQSRVYTNQISLSAIQSMELITGVAPAEFGDKTSLVAVATTKSGLGQAKPNGSFSVNYGSFGTVGTDLSFGIGDKRWGEFFAVEGLRTSRYLDSPEFESFHNTGNSGSFFDRIDLQTSSNDSVHLNLFAARSWFQAPNDFDQAVVGQDQRQLVRTWNFAPGWTHLIGTNTLLTANAWIRQDRLQYYPSADPFADQPETVGQGRRLTNAGVRVDLAHQHGKHNIKTGFSYAYTALSENFRFGITDPSNNPVCLDALGGPVLDPAITDPAACAGSGYGVNPALSPGLVPYDLTRGGTLFRFKDSGAVRQEAFYVQDAVGLGNWTAALGVRGDQYDGLVSKFLLQPRAGLSYLFHKTNTVLRGSYGLTMETPYNENLLLSSATGTGGLAANVFGSTVNAPLRPGTRNQFNIGFQQGFGRFAVLDGQYFWKFTHNAYDFNALGDTPIAFPIAWRKSKLVGFSVRLNLAEFKGVRAYTVMGHTRARFFNPEVGGLFFDTNPPTGVFRIDHDQAFQQTTNVQYTFWKARGAWTSFSWRYDSGLVSGAVPDYATALTLGPAEQAAIGLFCGSVFATRAAGIASCSDPHRGATLINIPADGTENDDKNPPRIAPRNLFDVGVGFDNIFRTDRVKWTAKFIVLNVTNKVALYNFRSTFSGTHFVTPRSYQGEFGFSF